MDETPLDPGEPESLQEAFARVERALDSGDVDLGALGYWGLVRQVKLDPMLSEHWAEQIGRIDRLSFEARVPLRLPVWLGNSVLVAGIVAGAAAVAVARRSADPVVAGIALVAAGAIWSVSVHCPAHWLVGRAVRIRFTHYFVGGPPPPRPGLKTDYESYLRAAPVDRARMHAAGAVATKLAPFVALTFYPSSNAPAWAAWGLVGLGLIQIATDVAFSTKSSDWKRVRRELRIARAQVDHRR